MARRTADNPHEKADALLSDWGWHYDVVADTVQLDPEEKSDGPPEKVDTCGHSDPTYANVADVERLLAIDAAVRAVIPEQLRLRLYEQYAHRLTQDAAATRHGMSVSRWRSQRDEARLIFWNLYHDRRRLARTPIPGSEDEKARDREMDRRERERRRQLQETADQWGND